MDVGSEGEEEAVLTHFYFEQESGWEISLSKTGSQEWAQIGGG